MKLILIIYLYIFSVTNFENSQLIFKIDFQSGFLKDTIGLKINNSLIFENEVATTCQITELTQLNDVKIYTKSKNTIVQYKNKEIILNKTIRNNYKFELLINKKKFIFYINTKNGKYIGFNKLNNKINYIQSNNKYYYY